MSDPNPVPDALVHGRIDPFTGEPKPPGSFGMTAEGMAALTPTDDYLPSGARRCHARSKKTGDRCKGAAMDGQRICYYHGGAISHNRRKAQVRLATLVDPAIGRLARILTQGNDRDALRAVENVLDRAGHPRKSEVGVEDAREMLLERLREIRGDAPEDFYVPEEPETVEGTVTKEENQ